MGNSKTDSYMFDSRNCNPKTVVVEQGFDCMYDFKITPAWYQIPKNPNIEQLDWMRKRVELEVDEWDEAILDFCNDRTWKNRHHILHEMADVVTSMTGFAVMLGATASEMEDVFEEVRLKNRIRKYHVQNWDEDDEDGLQEQD